MEEFLGKRDYTGAMAVLEFNRHSGQGSEEVCYMKFAQKTDSVSQVDLWLGYCAFHMGDYKRAMLEYEALTHAKTPPKVKSEDFHCERYFQSVWINLACCYFYLGMYRCSRFVFCLLSFST